LGRSIGNPRILSHKSPESAPKDLETPKRTV